MPDFDTNMPKKLIFDTTYSPLIGYHVFIIGLVLLYFMTVLYLNHIFNLYISWAYYTSPFVVFITILVCMGIIQHENNIYRINLMQYDNGRWCIEHQSKQQTNCYFSPFEISYWWEQKPTKDRNYFSIFVKITDIDHKTLVMQQELYPWQELPDDWYHADMELQADIKAVKGLENLLIALKTYTQHNNNN